MAYSITQARPLLNAAELELFDQSRASPIKGLTLARLRAKVTRVRALRDKYRDLFRRQTVAVRKAPATKGRSPVGADNERTQRKADILQEVLERFEARVAQLETRETRDAEGAATAKPAPRRATPAKKTSQGLSTVAAKTAAPGATKKPAANSKSARPRSTDAAEEQPKASRKAAKPAAKPKTQGSAAKPQAATPAVPPQAASPSPSPSSAAVQPALAAVLNQHATRSTKAPSDMAPTANGKAHAPIAPAPTSLVPAALRGNTLKQAPGQIAIHAHQGASMRRAQGQRDSR
jgi:hypothetical protein